MRNQEGEKPGNRGPRPGKNNPEKSGNGQLWFYWIVGGGLWIWTIFALTSSSTGILPLASYLVKGREAENTMKRVEVRLADLTSRVNALRNDPFSMERQAREREHRLRPGEILVLPGKEDSRERR